MRIGRGVMKEHGLERPSLLADAFEAVVAAVYLERGYDAAKAFVHDALAEAVADAARRPSDVDPKTRLRQWAEANGLGTPVYEVVGSSGPIARRDLRGDRARGRPRRAAAKGRSKKRAEVNAAEAAWEERAMPELPEVETVRASLARDLDRQEGQVGAR